MENRHDIDELIIKSLGNTISAEEEAILAGWLNVGETNRKYFESVLHVWQLTGMQQTVDAIEPEAEWRRFQRSVRRPVYSWMAAAASVLLFIMAGWLWWNNRETPAAPRVVKTITPPSVTWKMHNTSASTKYYVLPDGSQARLATGAELSWQQPFADARRAFYMKGTAQFNVAKDSTRPFVVLAGPLSVTALGTLFTIEEKTRTTAVRLYEGKLLVEYFSKKVYLLPGQELVFDRAWQTTRIHRLVKDKNKELPVEDIPLPEALPGNWYMFNNQSLGEVLESLKAIYEVDIVYNPKDVQKLYFIGKFNKSDSIETILKQIATLNHLTVVKEPNRFIISK
jgi:Fe2+-dicitrate sensor, membrane component